MNQLIIVGGGVAGLSAAWRARRMADERGLPLSIRVLEAGDRTGGKIRSEVADGFLVEWAANGWLPSAHSVTRVALELGLRDQIVPSSPAASRRYAIFQGRPHALGADPFSLLGSSLWSLPGRLRMMLEPFIPAKRDGVEETVHAFASRRIGREAAERLVSAGVVGIFAGDDRRLSLDAAFPQLRAMEVQHGSLLLGLIRQQQARARAARASRAAGGPELPTRGLLSFRGGMQALVDALAFRSGASVECGARVRGLTRLPGDRWQLELEGGEIRSADAVLLAAGAWPTSDLLRPHAAEAADALGAVVQASLAIVALAYPADNFARAGDGFGFLVPSVERLKILGALWDANVYPGRAPDGQALVRVMLGGMRAPELLELGDRQLVTLALAELEFVVGLRDRPSRTWVVRHSPAIPQYELGHRARIVTVDRGLARLAGLHACGNWRRGPAVGMCIEDGEAAATAALDELAGRQSSRS